MMEAWVLWLFMVGLAVGGVVTWLLTARLPRHDDDVGEAERQQEAAWISAVIERHGGVAPRPLVEEVLDLHQAYLHDPRLWQAGASTPAGAPLPPTPPPVVVGGAPPPTGGAPQAVGGAPQVMGGAPTAMGGAPPGLRPPGPRPPGGR